MRQRAACAHVAADGLEAALRVGEAGGERRPQQEVVAARDDLPLRAPSHPRGPGQPGADREVGVTAEQRRDERQQRSEVGREVDVHVGEHLGVGVEPDLVQRAATPLLVEVDNLDVLELVAETPGDRQRPVRGGVVRDRDPEGVREGLGEVVVEPPDARLEVVLLVEHGDDDVEDRDGLGDTVGVGLKRGRCHGPKVAALPGTFLRRPWESPVDAPQVTPSAAGPYSAGCGTSMNGGSTMSSSSGISTCWRRVLVPSA